MEELPSEAQRRRAIDWAISLTTDTPLEPEHYERHLLEQYAQGALTLDEVLTLLAQQVRHILYCSEEAQPFSQGQLAEMLQESEVRNEAHRITGLLCYSQGHFVQLLEGPSEAVTALFTNIRRDTRHHSVECLSDGAGPTRWFPDWRMAFVRPNPVEFYWLTNYLEARRRNLVLPHIPLMDPHLLTLLHAFSEAR